MKHICVLILTLIVFQISTAQENIFGKYSNELGETLILNPDFTFEYSWNFDLASSWNIGTWKIKKNKFIALKIKEIKDSIVTKDNIDIVLSSDKISNEITYQENILNSISGGGQSRHLPPNKLIFKDNKLYTYSESGKIQNKKLQSAMNANKLAKPWFEKVLNSKNEKTKIQGKQYKITGKIINKISLPPDCGYIAFATVMEFEIINSNFKDYTRKSIPIIVCCPEFYEDNFFNKDDIYKITIADEKQTDFGWTIPNIEITEKYQLKKKYWLINIEK